MHRLRAVLRAALAVLLVCALVALTTWLRVVICRELGVSFWYPYGAWVQTRYRAHP